MLAPIELDACGEMRKYTFNRTFTFKTASLAVCSKPPLHRSDAIYAPKKS
jgi:hypothetical protein